jgi:antitoxin component YwqK of YwqJK toxin-antitoxin module
MRIFWLIFIIAAAACLIWVSRETPNPSSPTPTIRAEPLSLLARQNARLYRTGETNAFTGFAIEHHQNGTLKSRSMIIDGLLQGLSEGWFTNGQKQLTEHFLQGVSHGQRLKWYADGQKHSEAQIAHGEFHGTFRRWHPNGTLAEEVQFEHGKPHGSAHAYYPSGFLKRSVIIKHGAIIQQNSYSDGERQASADNHGFQLY